MIIEFKKMGVKKKMVLLSTPPCGNVVFPFFSMVCDKPNEFFPDQQ
jgi:hypothetical protein